MPTTLPSFIHAVADFGIGAIISRVGAISRRTIARKIDRLYMQIEKEDPNLIAPASGRKAN